MGAVYATLDDVTLLGRSLTADEQQKAEALLVSASALLRKEASRRGYDLDGLIAEDEDMGELAKSVTVQAVVRALDAATGSPAASQGSQSGLGYSVSYTYLNAGQGLYFLKNELKQMGLMTQQARAVEVFDVGDDTGD
jgi:hypothetical protein